MTFKDSSWRMSIVVAAQPHFKPGDQDARFSGATAHADHVGDYVKKPMRDCTGASPERAAASQLHWEEHQEEIMADVVNVIPLYDAVCGCAIPAAGNGRPAAGGAAGQHKLCDGEPVL